MKIHLDDSIHVQTGNPATRAVNPGKRKKEGWVKERKITFLDLVFMLT